MGAVAPLLRELVGHLTDEVIRLPPGVLDIQAVSNIANALAK